MAERDKTILLLVYKERKTDTEIAAMLHVTHQRISQIRARARRAVKKYYASHIKRLEQKTPLQLRYMVRRVITTHTPGACKTAPWTQAPPPAHDSSARLPERATLPQGGVTPGSYGLIVLDVYVLV